MTLIDLVPGRKWSEQMDAIPALREASKDSALIWDEGDDGWVVVPRSSILYSSLDLLAAWTVQEMLGWLLDSQRLVDQLLTPLMTLGELQLRRAGEVVASVPIQDLDDPDTLVHACIAAASA